MSRALCPRCERPLRTCLCQWIRPCANQMPVLILQHPDETREAKNSATLLQLSLTHCERQVGEHWPPETLEEILGAPEDNLLLYPDTWAAGTQTSPTLTPEAIDTASRRLVVIDATWRKSRKMLHLNPALQTLPRLALADTPPSRYRIRRAQKPGQLSTLEASCYALARLEREPIDYEPLLEAFDGFNDQQLAFRPK
ncbi:tRNA-uridine aminocarboxypropyltransferase [Marinimicrobium sp. C2-29]|uniref:tRNA-uridine aminocarboxypropyltransferase n=1 Tax=Marinimicrobium sp. C2-29 TaxID=3139825 RepID=UPI003139DDCA